MGEEVSRAARLICCEVWWEEEEEESFSLGLVVGRLLWVHRSSRCNNGAEDKGDGHGAVILLRVSVFGQKGVGITLKGQPLRVSQVGLFRFGHFHSQPTSAHGVHFENCFSPLNPPNLKPSNVVR